LLTLFLGLNAASSGHRESLVHFLPSTADQDGPVSVLLPPGQSFSATRRQTHSIRCMHLNIRSIYSPQRRVALDALLHTADELDLDMLAVNETWMNGASIDDLKYHRGIQGRYRIRACMEAVPGEQRSPLQGKGALLLIKEHLACHISETERIPGRAVKVRLLLRGAFLNVISLYAPSAPAGPGREETAALLPTVLGWLEKARRAGERTLILGDLNGTFNPMLDRSNGTDAFPDSLLISELRDQGMCDLWRAEHPHARDYTHTGHGRSGRIDHVLGDDFILANLIGTAIGVDDLDTGSDHRPVFVEVGGVGLVLRLPRVPSQPRSVLDLQAAKAADWHAFGALTMDLPPGLAESLARLEDSEDPKAAVTAVWSDVSGLLQESARQALPFKTVGHRRPPSAISKESVAIRTISAIIRGRQSYAGNEQLVTDKLFRLRELFPDLTVGLDVASPEADFRALRHQLLR
jgi:exonuclease III